MFFFFVPMTVDMQSRILESVSRAHFLQDYVRGGGGGWEGRRGRETKPCLLFMDPDELERRGRRQEEVGVGVHQGRGWGVSHMGGALRTKYK